jgi:hypothetical protein
MLQQSLSWSYQSRKFHIKNNCQNSCSVFVRKLSLENEISFDSTADCCHCARFCHSYPRWSSIVSFSVLNKKQQNRHFQCWKSFQGTSATLVLGSLCCPCTWWAAERRIYELIVENKDELIQSMIRLKFFYYFGKWRKRNIGTPKNKICWATGKFG